MSFALAKPLQVLSTIGMIADSVEVIGADCVESQSLMGPGVDPHLYQASASDVRSLRDAEVIFYSGYHLEGQLAEVLARFAKNQTVISVAEEAIDTGLTLQISEHVTDPHVWMDVSLWQKTIPVILETLSSAYPRSAYPQCQEAMQARATAYEASLSALDSWVRESIASIATEQRLLVTAHDAFAYYGRAYDLEVSSVQGISTQAEASISDIRNVVDQVIARKVPAIFVESSVNPATIEAVLAAVEAEGQNLKLGETLFSDAMGEKGTVNGNYIGMIYHNTRAITEALGGRLAPLPEALQAWAEAWDIE
ncbi:MAG: zinc ABC transporter substrate-binding protein [Deinococcales bacterium]